jgi:glycosyltransferase involved in cell wall biosynthesis
MVVGAYYPELAGGSLQCRTLVEALRDRVSFSILATTKERALPPLAQVDGIPVYRVFVDLRKPSTKISGAMSMLGLAPSLVARHDIFHFHGFTEKMLLLLAAAKLSGRRTIEKMTSLGWDDPIGLRARPLGGILAAAQVRADRLVAVSPAMRARCLEAGVLPRRIADIPNGVDALRFSPADDVGRAAARRQLGLPATSTIVTFVGFWSVEKGAALLFDAWRAVRLRTGVDTMLVYVGSTADDHAEVDAAAVESVRETIAREHLGDHVRFVNATTHVPAYLQASDIFALPSAREGLPNALLEAMATGLPSIAARIDGVTDYIIEDGKNGWLVPPADPEALSQILSLLLEQPDLRRRVGGKARETIRARFTIDAVAARYDVLYHELMSQS